MEIIPLKKNEIIIDYKNELMYKIVNYTNSSLKNEKYGNFKDLDHTKARLDLLDKNLEKVRRAAAKYLHEYELVKLICKKNVISRAYFKLYEMIYHEPIVYTNECNCFFICEAPGGFIECITDIRRKKNLRTKFISISKMDNLIKYDNYLEENCLMYGDMTDPLVIEDTINKVLYKFPNGLDIITADGGFDVKTFNSQEILSSKLLFCEIYIALKTQRVGGMFIIKFFDMFSHNSIIYYLILCSFYEYVKIIKPKTSRNCNSERYLICSNFKGNNLNLLLDFHKIICNFVLTKNEYTLIYPNFKIENELFIKNICTFNNLIIHEQIKTINESIKMVNNKDTYFQNMVLNIFLENKFNFLKFKSVLFFKNILNSRIKKCIEFLKCYNINTITYFF